ncbi:MAG TPA: site-specific DNA-methyltransferase [Thermoplasmata archaeon]|nr:site-specific DNA-methyltransferase [Thermoplasmata archaeon]
MIPRSLRPAILQGHVVEVLPTLPEESIHCVVSSPPYWGLRTYGTPPQVWGGFRECIHGWETATIPSGNGQVTHPMLTKTLNEASATRSPRLSTSCRQCGAWKGELGLEPTPDLYVDHLADVFDAVHRTLRSDGTLWLNLGDTYCTHPAGLVGAARWKSSTLVVRDRTGPEQAGSIDKRTPGLKEKDLVGIPWKVAFELRRRGWYLREDCIWAKKNPMPEPVRDRPTRSHEYVFLFSKSRRYFYDAEAVREPLQDSSVRRLRHHLPNPRDNPRYRSKHPRGDYRRFPMLGHTDPTGRNLRSVWQIATQPYPGAHFATFPEALPEVCIRAGTSAKGACAACGTPWVHKVRAEGGGIGHDWHPNKSLALGRGQGIAAPGIHDGTYRRIDMGFRKACACLTHEVAPCVVLDPFVGSGTVLAVARRLRRRSIGIDLNRTYAALARERIADAILAVTDGAEAST